MPGLLVVAVLVLSPYVCVVEKAGVFRSISRSVSLTRGYTWKLVGCNLAALIAYTVSMLIVNRGVDAKLHPFAAHICVWPLTMFVNAFLCVFYAVFYHRLRATKEGIPEPAIAALFD